MSGGYICAHESGNDLWSVVPTVSNERGLYVVSIIWSWNIGLIVDFHIDRFIDLCEWKNILDSLNQVSHCHHHNKPDKYLD